MVKFIQKSLVRVDGGMNIDLQIGKLPSKEKETMAALDRRVGDPKRRRFMLATLHATAEFIEARDPIELRKPVDLAVFLELMMKVR